MLPKPQTVRDHKYIKWLRCQPCVICSSPYTEAHHTTTGGIGLKGSDHEAVALCHAHHQMIHQHHGKSGAWMEEQRQAIVSKLRAKYLKEKMK